MFLVDPGIRRGFFLPMKFQVVSDLHLDFRHGWKDVIQIIVDKKDQSDTLIIAGDLAECRNAVWGDSLRSFADNYKDVIFVPGNHEYYHADSEFINKVFNHIPSNVHLLDQSCVTIDNQIIAGCTLWFPVTSNSLNKKMISDFRVIPDFESWVYQKHQSDIQFLSGITADIVITHHAPHPKSVAPQYMGNSLNKFFVNNLENLILKINPKYWIHGHTHDPFLYEIGSTTVICNPLGYPRERLHHDSRYPSCCYEIA